LAFLANFTAASFAAAALLLSIESRPRGDIISATINQICSSMDQFVLCLFGKDLVETVPAQ
jgi:hypothetical protein